jgi:hypothetical protein
VTLRRIFEELYATAALQGEASRQLAQGAAILVRVDGQRRQVVLSRQGVPLGTIEIITFQAHGGIPDYAVGVSYLPTASGRYRVAFTWEVVPPLPTLFDLSPTNESHVTRLLREGEPLPGSLL